MPSPSAILTRFIDKGFISKYSDLYHLDKYKEEIIKEEGFGIKSYNNLIESINKSRKVKLANFIYALGIKWDWKSLTILNTIIS